MQHLKSVFESKSNSELLAVVDSLDMYTPEALAVALKVFNARNILPESVQIMAKEHWRKEVRANFSQYLKSGEIPTSKFLNPEELKNIFSEEYQDYVEKRESMAVDSTKYWFV